MHVTIIDQNVLITIYTFVYLLYLRWSDFVFVFVFVPYPVELRGLYWLCTQKSCLVGFRELYGMLGIEHRLVSCKAFALTTVLSLWLNLRQSVMLG